MNSVMAIKSDRHLMLRTGITRQSPIGSGWKDTGKIVRDASIGDYGIWVVNYFGFLQFAPLKIDENLNSVVFQWIDVNNGIHAIHAGHGGSLWGIMKNGTLVKRENVTMNNPIGTKWKTFYEITTSVTTSVNSVYRTLVNGTVLKREGFYSLTFINFSFLIFF